MKKLFLLAAALIMLCQPVVNAQTAAPAPAKQTTTKSGKPDMRRKENKQATSTKAGPMKKDGTPDMRYKANKQAAKKK